MTIIGIGLLGVAVVAVVVGLYQRSKLRQIAAAEPATCGQLRDELGQAGAVAPTTVVSRRRVRSKASRSSVRRAGPASAGSSDRDSVSRMWGGTMVQKTGSKPGVAVMPGTFALGHCLVAESNHD